MRRFLSNWSFVRFARLALGVSLIGMAISERNWMAGLLGSVLILQAALNTGCGFANCAMPPSREELKDQHVEFEEITPAQKK